MSSISPACSQFAPEYPQNKGRISIPPSNFRLRDVIAAVRSRRQPQEQPPAQPKPFNLHDVIHAVRSRRQPQEQPAAQPKPFNLQDVIAAVRRRRESKEKSANVDEPSLPSTTEVSSNSSPSFTDRESTPSPTSTRVTQNPGSGHEIETEGAFRFYSPSYVEEVEDGDVVNYGSPCISELSTLRRHVSE